MVKVKLRTKPISGDRQTLYLDFYPPIPNPETGKLTRREFLGLYKFNKKSPANNIHNKETIALAENIRAKRQIAIQNEQYGFFSANKLNADFVAYFRDLANERKGSNHDNWISALHYLEKFAHGFLRFADLNEKICNDFRKYLLTSPSNRSAKISQNKPSIKVPLSQNSAVSYFNKFKAALKQAYKDEYLQTDLNAKVVAIKAEETIKNTLTIEELNKLAKTDCDNQILKRAVLFSASTGMPFKEMQNLIWRNIEVSDAFGIRIAQVRQKTNRPNYLNISKQAYALLGDRNNADEKVFVGLNNRDRYYHFHLWLARAGITKKITFHDLRHSYGTLQIDLGTDIYTLQKQMNHKNIKHTQIYAKVSDKLKQKAAERIKLEPFTI